MTGKDLITYKNAFLTQCADRETMRAATAVTHQDSQGMDKLPMYILWQMVIATCLSLLGGVTAYGAVKPIMISEAPPYVNIYQFVWCVSSIPFLPHSLLNLTCVECVQCYGRAS